MKGRREHRPHAHRRVLALLAVLASMVYLNRQVEPGGVMVPAGALAAPMGAMRHAEAPGATARQGRPRSATTAMSMPGPGTPDGSSSVVATDAAPNAPRLPAHDHGAHCPFCFTAAFAVVADGLALPAVHLRALPPPERGYARPHLLALGHADARGPPDA